MDHTTMEYWIINSDSFLHQIFMIVMSGLYGFAWLFGISYKAANIYLYFVLFPLSFFLFFKDWKGILILPVSLLFFLIPGFESLSNDLFNISVNFLNWTAEIFKSDYVTMSVYICVLIPLVMYLPFTIYRFNRNQLKYLSLSLGAGIILYMIVIYPFFKDFLMYVQTHYA
ncbi:hypothetical protein I6U49_04365 [Salegentibacter sp. F63223]|nr:hypothetical protein [Salegentibacter maritimus]